MIGAKMKKYTVIKIVLICLMSFLFLGGIAVICINGVVKKNGAKRMLSLEEAKMLEDVDCVLVLGCWVNGDTPSLMLKDRLNKSIELYDNDVAEKLLMSGDHGRVGYNEVEVMKQYAMEAGIVSSDIFMDHAGFSTYESLYRAKEIFGADKLVIVSQEYHLYRALYIADKLGIEAYGVAADKVEYAGQKKREAREILARVKDFFYTLIKPKPTYLGEMIPVSGNGDITND